MEKRKFNGRSDGYDMLEVVDVMRYRLEEDGFKVDVIEKPSRTPKHVNGSNVYVRHEIVVLACDKDIIPDIIDEEADYIGDELFDAMKRNTTVNTCGTYGIVLVGERDTTNDSIRFSHVEGFLKNVLIVTHMGKGRQLTRSELVEMRTQSKRFADFRKFINDKSQGL